MALVLAPMDMIFHSRWIKAIPGEAGMVDDIGVGFEGADREPVVPHELPDVLDGIELWGAGREPHQCDVFRDIELVGGMPAGLIEEDDGVGAGRHLG